MWIVIHGGTPKTGTTALQQALHGARGPLARRGILYPRTVIGGPAHHALVAGAMTADRLQRRGSLRGVLGGVERGLAAAETFWETLRADLRRLRPEGIVLSSEYAFRGMTDAEIARLHRQLLDLSDDLRPLVYLREPLGFFASECLQNVKMGRPLASPSQPSLKQATQRWRAAFGRLEMRIFDRATLGGGGIVSDLLGHVLGRPDLLALVDPVIANESLSAEAAQIVQSFRSSRHPDKAGQSEPQTVALIRALQQIEAGAEPRRAVLRPAVQTAILQRAAEYLWLREREGLVFPGLDYSRIAAQAPQVVAAPFGSLVREIFEFDPARQDRLLALLRRAEPELPV